MIQAVLEGKSSGFEYKEDILTSTVLGTLKYIRPEIALIPFIESAFLYNKDRTTLWEELNTEGIELRCYREVEYVFWAWNQNYGEPDLILIFRDHVHGLDDLLLVVEAKFKSGKSGTGENDQLARYFEAVNQDIEAFTEPSVSGFKGRRGHIIYLTEAEAFSDIAATARILHTKYNGIKDSIFHLRWHQLYKILEEIHQSLSTCEKAIVSDLMKLMEKVGLRDFSGISLPNESLSSEFLLPYPVFFYDEDSSFEKNTYFDNLDNLVINMDENIFYRGNHYE